MDREILPFFVKSINKVKCKFFGQKFWLILQIREIKERYLITFTFLTHDFLPPDVGWPLFRPPSLPLLSIRLHPRLSQHPTGMTLPPSLYDAPVLWCHSCGLPCSSPFAIVPLVVVLSDLSTVCELWVVVVVDEVVLLFPATHDQLFGAVNALVAVVVA